MTSKYNCKKVEKKWREIWNKNKIYEPNLKRSKNPFYNLMMFPYPSAEGLHIGNMYAFVGADIYGRFMRMRKKDVFEPIGLDGFGIHSENYALKINAHPAKLSKQTEKTFYKQLQIIGNGFAWDKRLETYDPEYYKWTQWIFIQMFKNGLAYRKKAEVNWCANCKTVLANEQVIEKSRIKNQKSKKRNFKNEKIGVCERCDTPVIKKELEQWFFKITNYVERLLNDLEEIDWSERVKIAQRNWIGRSEGTEIKFKVQAEDSGDKLRRKNLFPEFITVFTTRPDTIFGATYLVLNPLHPIIENLKSELENRNDVEEYIKKTQSAKFKTQNGKTGIELKGIKAVNPANNKKIPIWISDYVLTGYGTGAIMAVPAHDQRDFEFAKKFKLPIKIVVCPNYPEPTCPILDEAYEEEGHLVDSENFTGIKSENAKLEITKWLLKKGLAEKKRIYRLRDWLISRQRYWGPPIPMIFCKSCKRSLENSKSKTQTLKLKNKFSKGELENPGWIAVPEKNLPVKLPFIKNFKPLGAGESPLASVEKFYKTKCPRCKKEARRETDVSDTFLDSSWYFFRYLDSKNVKKIFDKKITKKWLPVDMYIGGAEHSVLHLLYARFITKVFYDWKLIDFDEPFKKFRAHGLIIKDGAKMSKSKGNVVNPDEYIKKFGTDAIRLYLMFIGPFEQGGDFRDTGIRGITRFLERVRRLNSKLKAQSSKPQPKAEKYSALEKILHQSIKKITEDIENLRYNTAISQLMILLNEFEKKQNEFSNKHYDIFLKLLSPFAPFIAEEIWQSRCRASSVVRSIHLQKWPEYDPEKTKEKTFELIIQINGKKRDQLQISENLSEEEIKKLTISREKVKNYLGNKLPEKIIYVPRKIINIVLPE
jgi:leucyl-tRNA synthetase